VPLSEIGFEKIQRKERIKFVKNIRQLIYSVNRYSLDASGLKSFNSMNQRLKDSRIEFHLSKVKGTILGSLKKTKFYEELKARIHHSLIKAVSKIESSKRQESIYNY
jgi:MFS superfamily sulfate permease-like transporter